MSSKKFELCPIEVTKEKKAHPEGGLFIEITFRLNCFEYGLAKIDKEQLRLCILVR